MSPVLNMAAVEVEREGTRILHNLDWSIRSGEHWVLFGPNGAGKTTLLNLLTGYIWPTAGTVDVLGHRLGEVNLFELRRHIAVVSDPLHRMIHGDLTGANVLVTGARAHLNLFGEATPLEREHARMVAEITEISPLLDKPFRVMSTGERQRLMIARALMIRPRLLILDEPCAGLDLGAREFVLQTIGRITAHAKPPVIVLTTHHVEEITPAFTHCLMLSHGEVFMSGPVERVLTSRAVSRLFGMPIRVTRRDGRITASIAG